VGAWLVWGESMKGQAIKGRATGQQGAKARPSGSDETPSGYSKIEASLAPTPKSKCPLSVLR